MFYVPQPSGIVYRAILGAFVALLIFSFFVFINTFVAIWHRPVPVVIPSAKEDSGGD